MESSCRNIGPANFREVVCRDADRFSGLEGHNCYGIVRWGVKCMCSETPLHLKKIHGVCLEVFGDIMLYRALCVCRRKQWNIVFKVALYFVVDLDRRRNAKIRCLNKEQRRKVVKRENVSSVTGLVF